MEKSNRVYDAAKPDGSKINGKGSDLPWTAKNVKDLYKQYILKNNKKPPRKIQEEWAWTAIYDPNNTDTDKNKSKFTGSSTFFTKLIKRERLQEFYEKHRKKMNDKKYGFLSSDDNDNDYDNDIDIDSD